jgi:hypothetical protein
MTPSSLRKAALCTALVALDLAGCRPAKGARNAANEPVPTIKLPPPRKPRPMLSAADAALVYPAMDKVDRDPFLTSTEEYDFDHKVNPEPEVLLPAKPVGRRTKGKKTAKGPDKSIVQKLHKEVKGIIVGPRNTFEFEDHLYEEGDTLPKSNWVVTSITESGIRLRTEDGAMSDFLKFQRDAALEFKFNGQK